MLFSLNTGYLTSDFGHFTTPPCKRSESIGFPFTQLWGGCICMTMYFHASWGQCLCVTDWAGSSKHQFEYKPVITSIATPESPLSVLSLHPSNSHTAASPRPLLTSHSTAARSLVNLENSRYKFKFPVFPLKGSLQGEDLFLISVRVLMCVHPTVQGQRCDYLEWCPLAG